MDDTPLSYLTYPTKSRARQLFFIYCRGTYNASQTQKRELGNNYQWLRSLPEDQRKPQPYIWKTVSRAFKCYVKYTAVTSPSNAVLAIPRGCSERIRFIPKDLMLRSVALIWNI